MTSCLKLDLQWLVCQDNLGLSASALEKNGQENLPNLPIPPDLVEVAKVVGAWGLKGHVSVRPYSEASVLCHIKVLWLQYRYQEKLSDRFVAKTAWAQVNVKQKPKTHSDVLLFQWANVNTPEQANLLKACRVFVSQSHFPKLGKDEFYWKDLIGLRVKNLALQEIGVVKNVAEYGAHPILEVLCAGREKNTVELIPFVDRHVPTVDLQQGFLVVDWYFESF